ncbi:MAG: cupin [Pseudomonadota bacterium]
MSVLKVFSEDSPGTAKFDSEEHGAISEKLHRVGVRFQQWQASEPIHAGDDQAKVLQAYSKDIDKLVDDEGYQTVDVISLSADHPDKAAMRSKFLEEHTHSEDEVRFFVDGHGLFTLHIESEVYEVLCERGDLIGVPANTRHWFDMGPNPNFVAIRFFNNPEGWVANFTGSDIAGRFSRLDN